ncbi:MAG: hypothetical protein R3B45_18315 [Bdellovibrionota bacterium]
MFYRNKLLICAFIIYACSSGTPNTSENNSSVAYACLSFINGSSQVCTEYNFIDKSQDKILSAQNSCESPERSNGRWASGHCSSSNSQVVASCKIIEEGVSVTIFAYYSNDVSAVESACLSSNGVFSRSLK